MSSYQAVYGRSLSDPESFWAEAAEAVHWFKKWDRVLDGSRPPFYRWFAGGSLNSCYNALDRHVEDGRADQPALVYDSPVTNCARVITYRTLLDEVARFAGKATKADSPRLGGRPKPRYERRNGAMSNACTRAVFSVRLHNRLQVLIRDRLDNIPIIIEYLNIAPAVAHAPPSIIEHVLPAVLSAVNGLHSFGLENFPAAFRLPSRLS